MKHVVCTDFSVEVVGISLTQHSIVLATQLQPVNLKVKVSCAVRYGRDG